MMKRTAGFTRLSIWVGAVVSGSILFTLPLSAGETRPNLLVIMTDQQFAEVLGAAGNGELRTPAMDSLAAAGTRFSLAYCAHPLCVPSRTAMFTGRVPRELGVIENVGTGHGLPENTPTIGTLLSEAGYDCGYVGKWHLPIRSDLPDHGFKHGFRWMKHIRNNDVDPLIPGGCREFLEQDRDRPFLLVASFVNPHDICEWARDPATANRNALLPSVPAVDNCPALPGNFALPDDEPVILRELQPRFPRVHPPVDTPEFPGTWDEDDWRQYRWAYYRMVEAVDAHIGQVLKHLKECGYAENTVILFTSDHGDGFSAHQWNQKWVLYEESARVPFIVKDPRLGSGPRVDATHLINTGLDLLPTLCDYGNAAVPLEMRGISVRPLVGEAVDVAWRDHLVTETYWGPGETASRLVRTAGYKYIAFSRASLSSVVGLREQLFDLQCDPGETTNLVFDIGQREALEHHRRLLASWCRDTRDAFPVPRGQPLDQAP